MSSPLPFYAQLSQIEFLEKQYEQFKKDKESVDATWRYFFEGMELGLSREPSTESSKDLRIYVLINAYRTFGHLQAQFNPTLVGDVEPVKELDLETLGFKQNELEEVFPTLGILKQEQAPLSQILEGLKKIYCGKIGVEYVGMQSPALERWLQEKIEKVLLEPQLSSEKKKDILHQLNKAELFEIFLHTKYVGQKRFSLEGGETLIPLLHEGIETGAELGMEGCVIGMAHRGRLNVLASILNKSYSMIFSEFEDFYDPKLAEGMGDVKYHKGFSSKVVTSKGKPVQISLTPNPSHLESVDPVVEGKTLAKQIAANDENKTKIIPILIHGDASLAGQGVVYECLQLSRLEGYSTGGTLHIVVNNQIGFTTLPKDSRSTRYCTDIAKTFSAPVFHVSAEDPEGCILVMQIALEVRQRFHCDVFIDVNCYRKYGHNESDEPKFTQPKEYQLIQSKQSIREMYRDQLIREGIVEKKIAENLEEEFKQGLHKELEELKIKKEMTPPEGFSGVWKDYRKATAEDLFLPVKTSVDKSILKEIVLRFSSLPKQFSMHSKLKKVIEDRKRFVQDEANSLDWSLCEHLAFGSLLWEKRHVRLAGQDCCRGTFSQRHAVWVDQTTNERYFPLKHLKSDQGRFDVIDSLLSEFAALGFEFGYSLSYPGALVLWEAQFGDFSNGAQVIIDQYISSAEEKWFRFSGLCLLLPHGYEGQGPEHSSARMERFLQLAGNANIQIVSPSTPAQYFHVLRRQVLRPFRKPLIVFTPKGLLRHPLCVSSLDDLSFGTFQEILDEEHPFESVRRILLCSGRIYYDLLKEREKRKENVAIIRIEQLYPFHNDKLIEILKKYSSVKEFYWVQEEPRNMGAWSALAPILMELLPKGSSFLYAGRARSGSPAVGSHVQHQKEHEQIMDMAFSK